MKLLPWKAAVPVLVGVLILLLPVPSGLSPDAWYYFSLFAAVVVGLILEPLPAAAIGLIGVTLATSLMLTGPPAAKPAGSEIPKVAAHPGGITAPTSFAPSKAPAAIPAGAAKPAEIAKTADAEKPVAPAKKEGPTPAESIRWALTGFSDGTVWLIFIAFMFAMGYEKTGLGRRIALVLVRKLGRSTLGLGYAVALADLALAPFTPSNTARSGGTIFPVIKNIPPLYGSTPEENPRRIGSYLMWTALATTCITSSMFLTGLAPNLLALSLVQKTAKVTISWTEWFTGVAPVGLLLFLVTPYLIYRIYPPEQKTGESVCGWAAQEMEKMGKITRNELVMAGLAVLALTLWIFGGGFFNATTVALIVLCLMIIAGVVTWNDVVGNRQAWNVLVWFATLVTLADGLNKVGFLKWISNLTAGSMTGLPPNVSMVLLVVFFFVMHYLFASITAHVTALLPVILATAVGVEGINVKMLAMLLCFSLGIMGVITPYATGPSPIYYGSGYVSRKAFWSLGLVFGLLFLAALLGVGVPYLIVRKI